MPIGSIKEKFLFLNERGGKDFYFIRETNSKKIVSIILSLCKERLPNYYGVNPLKDIQVLTPP